MLLKALLSLFKSLQFVAACSFPFQCTMDVAFNGKRCAFELVGDFVGRKNEKRLDESLLYGIVLDYLEGEK